MDAKTQRLVESAQKGNPQLQKLWSSHQELNHQVDMLNDRAHLTAEDEVELSRLKKEKLHIRDQIEEIVYRRQSA